MEIDDIYGDSANEEWLEAYFADSQHREDSGATESLIRQIQEMVRFIRDHGSAKEKVTELKRGETSFGDFEKTFDEAKLLKELATINQLKERWDANLSGNETSPSSRRLKVELQQNLDIDPQEEGHGNK